MRGRWCDVALALLAGACGGNPSGASMDGAPPEAAATGTGGGAGGVAGVSGSGGRGDAAGGDDAVAPPPDAAPTADEGSGGGFDGAPAGCAPGAVLCDDFESYPLVAGITQLLAPTWVIYKFHGSPRVDASKPFRGKQNAHVDTEAGDLRYAGFVHQTDDAVAAVPSRHFGRVMIFLKALPTKSDWNVIHASGLLPGSTTKIAQYSVGGVGNRLALSYAQRTRVLTAAGAVALRGGGRQNEDPPPDLQCAVTATTSPIAAARWLCFEWQLDIAKGDARVWLDGAAQTELDVAGGHTTAICSVGAAPASWQPPAQFTKLVVDWEAYQKDAPQQDAWFDDFAVGTQRLGCPAMN